jgi:hypothetical protein
MTGQPHSQYPSEEIPGEDSLFRRVPRNRAFPNGNPRPGAFSDKGAGMSASWSRYARAEECRGNPPTCGVVQLGVASVRGLGLAVNHTPRDFDRSHSDVTGEKDEETRLELAKMALVVFPPETK